MAFEYFIQPQGPRISTSLYGDAASQGINAGNALPTPIQSAVEGTLKGIETSQRITANQQQEQIRQEQIDRQDERAEAEDIALEINRLKLEQAQATELEQLDYVREKLRSDTAIAQQKRVLIEKEAEFSELFQNADPLEKKRLLFGGEYADVFANKPTLYKQTATNPQILQFATQEEKDSIEYNYRRGVASSAADKRREIDQEKFKKTAAAFESNSDIERMSRLGGFGDPTDFADNTTLVQQGQYKVDPVTKKLARDANKQLIPNPSDSIIKGRFDVVSDDTVIDSGDEKFRTLYESFKAGRDVQSGKAKQQALNQVDKDFAKELQGREAARAQAESAAQAEPEVPLTPEGQKLDAIAKNQRIKPDSKAIEKVSTLKIADDYGFLNLGKAGGVIETTFEALGIPRKGEAVKPIILSVSNWLSGIQKADDTIESRILQEDIARQSAELEFDSNPELQKQYTAEAVLDHNKLVAQYEGDTEPSLALGSRFEQALTSTMPFNVGKPGISDLSQLEKVESPKDLFILNRRGFYEGVLEDLRKELLARIKNNGLKSPISKAASAQIFSRIK